MPPIKRTKFKLNAEELLEMYYWLKLIRAFDERLSLLVRQGKVRSGVYTGIGQEAIIVGTCFGLRKEDYICPLHRDLGALLQRAGFSAPVVDLGEIVVRYADPLQLLRDLRAAGDTNAVRARARLAPPAALFPSALAEMRGDDGRVPVTMRLAMMTGWVAG